MLEGESLSKLSIAELKKRIFWCGVSVPPGHLEKSDLVAVLGKALDERAEKERERQHKAEQQKADQQRAQYGTVRADARPINYDKKLGGPEQEIVDLHIQPEEELKKRIEELGGTIPEGKVSKFYLIALLKNCRRQQAEAAAVADPAAPFPGVRSGQLEAPFQPVQLPPKVKDLSEAEALAQTTTLEAWQAPDQKGEAGAKTSALIEVADVEVQCSAGSAGRGSEGRPARVRKRAGTAPTLLHNARGKRKCLEGQVLVSDDEDQVRAVGGAPISLDDDEEPGAAHVTAVE